MSLVFVCDESGAKWPATNPERFPGEVGVMAGFIVPADRLATIETDLNAICLQYRKPGRKLHATDLGPDAEPLRAALYDYLLTHDIPILYDAIHSHGFHDCHRNNPNAANESLHTAIALGAFGKVVAYAAETGQEHSIRVFTDRVDPPVMKGFFEAFEDLLDDDPVVEIVKRGHPNPEKRQKAWIVTQTTWPDDFDAESFRIEGFSVDLDAEESGLTVAADFVAGGLVYYFQKRSGRRFASSLGKEGDVAGFPLERLCWGLTPSGGYPGLGDTIFRHPIEATRWEVEELLYSVGTSTARDRLTELVRGRAYMIHVSHKGAKAHTHANWMQAREELGIPADVWL